MFNISGFVMNDHDLVFRKIDDSGIYQTVKNRSGLKGGYVDIRSVTGNLDGDSRVALVDKSGALYYSTHPKYGF